MKKPIIRYYLKAKSKNPNDRTKEELIQAKVQANFKEVIDCKVIYNRFFVSLKSTIKPKNFGLIKDNFNFNEDIFNNFSKSNKGVKTAMQLFEGKVDELYSNYLLNDINPTSKQFKNDLLIQLGRKKREVKKVYTILNYLNKKIEYFESIKGSSRKDEISENSIKPYRTLAHYIERYELYANSKLTFQNLDEKLYWEFWNFQDEVLKGNIKLPKKEGKKSGTISQNGFMISSIRKYQKTLFRCLKMAQKEGIIISLNINNSDLILEDKPNAKDIYINEEQLTKIYNHQATNENIQLAKDYVVLASLTGVRYESMEIAHEQKIAHYSDESYNFNYIHSFQNKTQTEVYIPLFRPVRETLAKYNNKFPHFPQNAVMNKLIKELFKEVGIKATAITTSHYYKNGIVKAIKQVSDLVTTHDLRKSFVTKKTKKNVSEVLIMNTTHPNSKPKHAMTTIYNKTTLLDNAKKFYDEVNQIKQSELYSFN